MKKSDLVAGRTYTNGRGRKRKLVARDCSGKTVFLTREAAKAALKEREKDES